MLFMVRCSGSSSSRCACRPSVSSASKLGQKSQLKNRTAPAPRTISRRIKCSQCIGCYNSSNLEPRSCTRPPAPPRPVAARCRETNMCSSCYSRRLYLPMKPTFLASPSAIERDRKEVVLAIPPCLQSPPDDTKAAVLPVKRAAVAMAALMVV